MTSAPDDAARPTPRTAPDTDTADIAADAAVDTGSAGAATGAAQEPEGAGTVVLLTEEPVTGPDIRRILELHEGEELDYVVLVPTDTRRNLLAEVVDHLSLGQLREALDAARGHQPDPEEARADATEVMEATLTALHHRGRRAEGSLTDDDPLPALAAAVRAHGAREVVVVSRPRLLEDTFHRDWAERARDELGVPVLHVYGGTTSVG